ncbi:hypothetical protein BN14_02630 [Rhizoctonia solani AG-1 IB]|uniref:Uncharacterized protein n=1 Tax=Thanatephorus cucumeris (strain AG1-IB / isolate 7/3/14) TaxID=1108050 RepID=M5BY33_THACB|nr:hypothetical protein BN14_02630 [Rhizoctonia solani AG-1 IB]
MLQSHNRQTSVASFASSLYLPVDPENPASLDDEDDTYPSSDELFGPDHEDGDDYTISSRRYLSSHSRYSSAFSHVSHPPTPPRSTRSTISLERPPSSISISLTQPHPSRHSNTQPAFSPSAWNNNPAVRAMASTSDLPSPPSTARSSHEAPMSAALEKLTAHSNTEHDPGVPIEKFDQLALEHLEQDEALLQMLRKLDDQKLRIAQLTYALSRLRILSNSACLSLSDSDAPIATGSGSVIEPRRLGAVIPKPLIVQQSTKSASSSIGRSTLFSLGSGASGLSGPSANEAVNQRRRAKQQLHEFALRRPARMAKSRGNTKPIAEDATARARRVGWEGARGSPSMVMRETKPRAAALVEHPNITVRRPKRPDPPHITSPVRTPRVSAPTQGAASSPDTPPRMLSLFSSPSSSSTSKSPQTPVQTHIASLAVYDSPSTPVPRKHVGHRDKPLPARPVSPTKPMRLARNISYSYEVPPVPLLENTTAHITLVDRATPPLPADEVQNRLAATFAHFSKSRAPSPQPSLPTPATLRAPPSPPRKALDFPTDQPDYLEHMLHQKWVAQLDEHSYQARGNWKSPLRAIRQKLTGLMRTVHSTLLLDMSRV